MKTSTSEGKHGIQWTSRMQLDDLDFADDLALLSQTQQQMQEKTNSVAAVGLNIHKGKSKVLRYNTACTNPITIDGEDLKNVKTFTYLGSVIDEHGGSDADVKAWIGKARAAYLQLRNIWDSKQPSTNTKWAPSELMKERHTAIMRCEILISMEIRSRILSLYVGEMDLEHLEDPHSRLDEGGNLVSFNKLSMKDCNEHSMSDLHPFFHGTCKADNENLDLYHVVAFDIYLITIPV
ncbi:unnamed protein product [Schistosoma margrebowiei]|uniref:Uncharacterized protein n=1 Tax=Schistosoma margrebowiei TaxID=48269 RepID=A0A183M6A4_9TREM|nr:unnamed protein product [Schistosoma margrebowiei]